MLVSKPYTFTNGATIVASEHNANFDVIMNDYNGNITNANIAAGAAIADTKLASITSTGKVSGASLTLLTSIPSGAGQLPPVNSGVPTGAIMAWSAASAPTGWLLCDGSAVSRSTYATLFALVSTTYGAGDASTTFNVPDLKGRFPIGLKGSDTDFDALGETGGAKTKNIVHTHGITGTTNANWAQDAGLTHAAGTLPSSTATDSGGSGTQDVMNPFIVLNYIIKY